MTNEIALHCMKAYSEYHNEVCEECPVYGETGTDHCFEDALNMAIKALETIPKYKDAYNKGWDDGAKATYEHLKMCEEETETGHWIDTNSKSFEFHRVYKCSECGTTEIEYPESIYRYFRYCPNCGAKMVEP